jgi:UDP-N-acetylmuramoyl-L-alanyl-D-glutamate--2,6-diaminopimelate ligase
MTGPDRNPDGTDLAWLLAGLVSAPRLAVRDLRLDSRAVRPGDAFVAVAGRATHGLDHVADAAARGAVAVLWDPTDGRTPPVLPEGVAAVSVPGLRPELGDLADRFYGEPSLDVAVTGITGTNGKTTSAWLLAQGLGADGAYLGTLGAGRPPAVAPATHTTPDVVSVHRTLRALARAGARTVAMEVSSHALDQERVAGVRIPVTAFTNLTRDHLDYHGSMEAYGAAKRRLFAHPGVEHAVINIDDPFGRELAGTLADGITLTRVQSRGRPPERGRFVAATGIASSAAGLEIAGLTHEGPFTLRSALVGAFNVDNLLLVLGLLLAARVPLVRALEGLAAAAPPPGRMEAFRVGADGPLIVVDYAHTPDALSKALEALRGHVRGQLWCVFGCGGERDPGKRPLMAAAAEALADQIVLTDDNPRGEDPARIVAMLQAGLTGRVPARVERDRARAIELAVAGARAGDAVLVAGKGHEDYQIYGAETRHFSDRELAATLARRAA